MPRSRSGSLFRPLACYFELPRIAIPRTSVNKGIKRGPEDGLLQRGVLGDLFITRSTVG